MKHKLQKNILIYVALVLVTVVTLFPILWAVASSLRTESELYRYIVPFSSKTLIPQEPTLAAYKSLFTEFNFQVPVINTLVVTLLTIFFSCLANSMAAFSFATFNFKFKTIIFGIVLISFMIPFEAIAMPLYSVVDGFGWVNTRAGIIIPCIADGLVLFLFTQFFKDIPPSLIEAARVDGAKWRTIFLRIIIPMSVPIFITAGLMIFMNQWNAYLWPLLVARSPEIRMIQTALGTFQTEKGTLWSLLYAGTMVSALVPLFLFLPFQKYFVQGITSSGVKG